MTADRVTVAYIHPDDVSHSWHESLLQLIGYDMTSGGVLAGWLSARCYGADGIPGARNLAIRDFLARKDTDWLLWVDTDMGFTPEALERLLEVADADERPIVGGLCFAQKHTTPDGMGGWRTKLAPTIYDWTELDSGEKGLLSRVTYPVNKVVLCEGTGSAFVLIHRRVFESIESSFGPVWYDRVPNPTADGRLMGEDLSFCLRAGALNFKIYVHTGVRTTHHKPMWLGEVDYWQQVVAPPATAETAILVPVMRRPQNAAPFMDSLRASTGLARVYAIAQRDDDDTIAAWRDAGARILFSEGPSFAEKVNIGYDETDEPWLFAVGDDVRFHPGWLDHAQAAATDTAAHVIGTNDLGPRVAEGETSPHMLIRRGYVDTLGASWDGRGVVCHEGYRHNCVDVEIALAAKQRGVWAYAPGSVVEHLHPLFGTGERDDVYDLGDASAAEDRELLQKRFEAHAQQAVPASA